MQTYSRWHRLLTFRRRNYFLLGTILLFLAACGPAAQEPPAEQPVVVEPTQVAAEAAGDEGAATEGYPAPLPTVAEAYPVSTLAPEPYPPAADNDAFQEPRFQLDAPVRAGSTTISGQAPPGMVLAIIDVTYNGATLGIGSSDNQGRFEINVNDVIEGHRLGVTFGELEPGTTYADMSVKYYPHRGDGFMNLPNVGIVLDSTIVEP